MDGWMDSSIIPKILDVWPLEYAINWYPDFDNMSISSSRDISRELMSIRHVSAFQNTAY